MSTFQHVCPIDVSEHASFPFLSQSTRVSFTDQGQKAFLNSLCHDMLLSLLSDRANVETLTVYKYLKCLPAMSFIKKIIALNFFCCHLPVWFYKKLLWVSFYLYWLKWKLCHQCVVWSFCSLAVSPNRKKCGLLGAYLGRWRLLA